MKWTPIEIQQAIWLAKAFGIKATLIARTYRISLATVYRVLRKLRELNPEAGRFVSTFGSEEDLANLKHSLILSAHEAIERSVEDRVNAHKAARTSLAYLRGTGEHGDEEGASDSNVQVLVSNRPPGMDEIRERNELKERYVPDIAVAEMAKDSED